MCEARNAGLRLVVASTLGLAVLSLAMLAQEAVQTKRDDADLEHGRQLYGVYCQRCHGPSGDDITCSGDMAPLAGLGRRPRVGLVAEVMSQSYFFRGRTFNGEDARDLRSFLLSLKGEKGLEDPGLVFLPRLLSKRNMLLDYYRVIDVRSGAAYAKGHVPNAVNWPSLQGSGAPRAHAAEDIARQLGLIAVRPEMTIVVYDDTLTPASALLWWDLIRAGQKNVAILDGGFRQWVEEYGQVLTVVTPFTAGTFSPTKAAEVAAVPEGGDHPVLRLKEGLPQPIAGTFDWERTVNDGQLRTTAEIREYLDRSGIKFPGTYRVEGNDAEAAFLVYVLRLVGHGGASYDPASRVLIADNLELR